MGRSYKTISSFDYFGIVFRTNFMLSSCVDENVIDDDDDNDNVDGSGAFGFRLKL